MPFLNFPFEDFLRNDFPYVVFCRFAAREPLLLRFVLRRAISAYSLSIFYCLIEKSCRIQENGCYHHLDSVVFQQREKADGQGDVTQGVDALCSCVRGI